MFNSNNNKIFCSSFQHIKLRKKAAPPTPKQMATWRENMERLEKLGCKRYQLLEAPYVLDFSEEKVYQQLDIMQQVLVKQVSIPLIGLITDCQSNDYQRRMKFSRYSKRMHGFCSLADLWMDILGCKEEEIEDLMLTSPWLLSSLGHFSNRVQKAMFLLESGVSRKELLLNTKVLTNISLETLKRRVAEVKALGMKKLPLKSLAQSNGPYEKAMALYKKRMGLEAKRWEVLCKLLNTSRRVLEMHPVFSMGTMESTKHSDSLEKKIRYLVDTRGYTVDDVLNYPRILSRSSVKRLDRAFHDLEEVGLDDVTLSMVHAYMQNKKLPEVSYGTQKALRYTLGSNVQEMAEVLPREYAGLFQQDPKIIRANFRFLSEDCGFERSLILNLPVILGHSQNVLVQHWKMLPESQSEHFTKWRADPQKLLNLLQYDIERSVNFKHRIITVEHSSE